MGETGGFWECLGMERALGGTGGVGVLGGGRRGADGGGGLPCRMTQACHRKCVPPHYKEAELSKGESVCLDRCVAKYLEVHERMGKKLTELSLQDEELLKRMQQGTGTA